MQPITVYTHPGPNPYKVLIILEELQIPYKKIVLHDPKQDWFLAINPNGRLPAIVDPNTDITLWESGAIIEYLTELYDEEGKLTLADPAGKWHLKQYLHFQMSGQGPYYGQAVWFHRSPDDMPVAKQRYIEQTVRVIEVLDNILKGKQWLEGDKVTYADLSFVPWNRNLTVLHKFFGELLETYEVAKRYPNFTNWHERMMARDSVKKAYEGA